MKRIFDILFASIGLILCIPLFVVVAVLIKLDDNGAVFFLQDRVGKDFKLFKIYKFRTMKPHSDKQNLLTIGDDDNRGTRIGYWLRRSKVDELPQLINVLIGNMSIVGPRPEVEKYVAYYTKKEKEVLSVLPGITSEASIIFKNESEILKGKKDPENYYISKILPEKNLMNLDYVEKQSFWFDMRIIANTVVSIFV